MSDMIQRQLLQNIQYSLQNYPAVVLLGARQVGKTTLAKMVSEQINQPSIYLDLELPSDVDKLSNPELFLTQYQDSCVIIDEVQRMPKLFPLLRAMIDKHRINGRFLLLGSSSLEVVQGVSESLAGRVKYMDLQPLHYKEVQPHYALQEHWFRGGFPELLLEKDDKIRMDKALSFIRTFVERDVVSMGLKTDPNLFSRFFSMVAHTHGQIWNASTLAKSLGVSVPTIQKYVSYIERSFLLYRLSPWHTNAKKRLVKSPKMYLIDSGLLHAIFGVEAIPNLMGNPIVGNSWEGYVIQQIRAVCGDKWQYYFYRTQDGTECDLVMVKNGQPDILVEIKMADSPKITKGFAESIKDLSPEKSYIITPNADMGYPLNENVMVSSLEAFLQMVAFS